ncbi:DUF4345 domain-containing protein [Phenylobacterium sp.]|uniref:DUF4345 domain-containing protein n=1 Tax=Phenylobacterium sp. TaxID=1871053 RepID=UPI00286DF74C|nr:DUF4345 domain-containing protein [Phenylobacterium sp.]
MAHVPPLTSSGPDRALLLRAVLALVGAFILYTGVNVALGGMATLGLQGSRDFFTVTDVGAFRAQDSHIRFFGGLWLAVGLVFAAGAARPHALRATLMFCCGLIFVGGLARFSALQPEVMFGPQLLGSVAAELIGMPLLALWLRALRA